MIIGTLELRGPLIFVGPLTVGRDPDSLRALIFRTVTDDDFGCHWGP